MTRVKPALLDPTAAELNQQHTRLASPLIYIIYSFRPLNSPGIYKDLEPLVYTELELSAHDQAADPPDSS